MLFVCFEILNKFRLTHSLNQALNIKTIILYFLKKFLCIYLRNTIEILYLEENKQRFLFVLCKSTKCLCFASNPMDEVSCLLST